MLEEAVPSGLSSLAWEVGRAREGVAARLSLALCCGLTATLLLAFLTLFLTSPLGYKSCQSAKTKVNVVFEQLGCFFNNLL